MKNKLTYIQTFNSLIVNLNGKSHNFHKESPYYNDISKAIKEKRHEDIDQLIHLAKKVSLYSGGNFEATEDGDIIIDGTKAEGLIVKKIFEFMSKGLTYEPLLKFVRRVRKNPSYSAQSRLYDCLETNKHPILEDGRFLAYKAVRNDFKDKYRGVFDNSPGKICEMARLDVDDNHNRTCSAGLHVASYEYAEGFMAGSGDRLVECAICPSEVVAIPFDYSNQKMRVCKYEVIRESPGFEIKTLLFNSNESEDRCGSCEEDLDDCCCTYCDSCHFPVDECSCTICDSCGDFTDWCSCNDECGTKCSVDD